MLLTHHLCAIAYRNHHIMPNILQGEAKDDNSDDHDRQGQVRSVQAYFSFGAATVTSCVVPRNTVVEPMASSLTDHGTDDAREVEKTWTPISCDICVTVWAALTKRFAIEAVQAGQPNGGCCIDADDPSEVDEVVYHAQQHRDLREGDDWA